jgi:hypothetical protein
MRLHYVQVRTLDRSTDVQFDTKENIWKEWALITPLSRWYTIKYCDCMKVKDGIWQQKDMTNSMNTKRKFERHKETEGVCEQEIFECKRQEVIGWQKYIMSNITVCALQQLLLGGSRDDEVDGKCITTDMREWGMHKHLYSRSLNTREELVPKTQIAG